MHSTDDEEWTRRAYRISPPATRRRSHSLPRPACCRFASAPPISSLRHVLTPVFSVVVVFACSCCQGQVNVLRLPLAAAPLPFAHLHGRRAHSAQRTATGDERFRDETTHAEKELLFISHMAIETMITVLCEPAACVDRPFDPMLRLQLLLARSKSILGRIEMCGRKRYNLRLYEALFEQKRNNDDCEINARAPIASARAEQQSRRAGGRAKWSKDEERGE